MLAIDIVKAEPKTELEAYKRWKNRLRSEYLLMPGIGKRINIKHITNEPVEYYVPSLRDYSVGGGRYMDSNGDYITKEEALAEIEWQIERYKHYGK